MVPIHSDVDLNRDHCGDDNRCGNEKYRSDGRRQGHNHISSSVRGHSVILGVVHDIDAFLRDRIVRHTEGDIKVKLSA